MVSFNSAVNLFFCLMICLTINIVHGDPQDDDVRECLRQIRISYGNCKTARQCFSHAVRYYKKGDYITDEGTLIPVGTSDQIQNFANQQKSIQRFDEHSDLQEAPLFNHPGSDIDYRGFDGQFSSLEDHYDNDLRFDDQMYVGQEGADLEDLSQYTGNFDGLQDFIQKDCQNNIQPFDGQSSEEYFRNNIQPFDGQSSRQEYEHQYPQNEHQYPPNEHQYPPNDHQYPPNYATSYYKELENMVQGTNILHPVSYCFAHYQKPTDPIPRSSRERTTLVRNGRGDQKCITSLKIFGRTPKSAARVALTKFRLDDCTNPYIYNYMVYIIKKLNIRSPSKNPSNFCQEIYKNKDWYLQVKGLK